MGAAANLTREEAIELIDPKGKQFQLNVELDATEKAMAKAMSTLLKTAISNLRKSKSIASGSLSDIKATDIRKEGGFLVAEVLMPHYWKFVDKGVNGVRRDRGSEFSFKNELPNRPMTEAIAGWMKTRGIRVSQVKKGREHGGLERRDRKVADSGQSPYWMAKKIKMYGIKPTKFFTNAVDKTMDKFKDDIALSITEDFQNSFSK
jgi:hypothetical protein